MAEYDGSIRIGTGIDTKEFKAGSKEIETEARRMAKTVSDSLGEGAKIALQKQTDAFVKMNQQYAGQEQKVKDLGEKLHELQRTKVETPVFKETSRELSSTEKKLDNLYGTLRRLEAAGKENTDPYKNAIVQIDIYKKKVSELQNQLKELETSGEAYQPADTSKIEREIAAAEQKQMQMYTALQTAADSLTQKTSAQAVEEERLAQIRENAVVGNQRIVETVERIKQLEQEIADLKAAGITEGYSDYDSRIRELEQLKQEVRDYANGTNEMQDSYKRLGQALTDLNGKLSSILRPIQKIQSAFAQDVKVSGYEKLQSSLGELGGIAIRAAETVKNAFATLKQGPTAVIHGLSSSLMNMANTVNSAMGSVLSGGLEKFGDGIGVVLGKLQQLASGIGSGISSALDIAKEKLAGFAGSVINTILHPFQTLKNVATTTLGGIANAIKSSLGSAMEGLKNRAAGLAASIINGIVHPFQTLKNVASASVKGISKLLSGMVSVAKKAGKAISSVGSLLKRAASSMLGFGKSAQKSNSTLGAFGSRFKSLALSLLIFNQISKAFNAMISGMKEGFGNLYKEVGGFKSAIDGLKASTLTLKNSFAAAFRPLVEIAIPYIQKAVDALAALMDMIGQFTAAITGQKTYTKAIKQTTEAIEDENKAQNKQLSGLDKLNNLSSGSGGSADSGASSQMFEENVPISNRFADIAQQFKDMWESADFTDLGKILGDKLKNALESIPWDSIQQTVAKVGKSFATFINGIVEVPSLALDIGKTIGEAINTGIGGINSFLDNTHWGSVGVFIGEALNGLVNAISWEGIGHFFAAKFNAIFETIGEAARKFNWINFGLELSNGLVTFVNDLDTSYIGASISETIKGLLDTAISFLENTDWKEFGNTVAKKISDFVTSIDWSGIADRVFEGIGAALGGLFAFLYGLIEDAWNSVVEWWNWTAFEDGKFTMIGLLDGIWEGIKNIGQWIYEHIFEPFIEGFKSAFGIHSPSTVMAEMGIYIMQGLLNGIKSLVSTVVGAIQDVWNGIKKVFEGFITFLSGVFTGDWGKAWEGIVEIFSGVEDVIKGIVNGILGIIESLANGVISGINFVIGALNKLSITIPATPWTDSIDIGFNIPELSQVSIPRLATGTVVPPNNEFLAVLGDNKREPEVVSPLSTIEQAVENAMRRNGGMGGGEITIKIPVEIDGRVLFELMKKFDLEEYRRTGRPSFQM